MEHRNILNAAKTHQNGTNISNYIKNHWSITDLTITVKIQRDDVMFANLQMKLTLTDDNTELMTILILAMSIKWNLNIPNNS